MRNKSYLYFFWAMNIAALVATLYLINDFVSIMNAISKDKTAIQYDSGAYYMLILTVFWIFTYIEYKGLKKGLASVKKHMNKAFIIWFSITILLGFFIPWYLDNRFEKYEYRPCPDPAEIHRISIGKSFIYKKGSCD